MSGGMAVRRRKKRRHHDEGARLAPLDVDVDITGELFQEPIEPAASIPSPRELVIDLPEIEKAPAPLPRRVEASRSNPN